MVHCFLNIWFNKRTHPNDTEMGISCQRNGHWHGPWHWAASNHLSVACGRAMCRKGLCIN